MDERDRKTLEDIERYGCAVIHVMGEGEEPPFSYSVGITRTSAAPEVVIVGFEQRFAHRIVNEYNRRVRAGERFVVGARYGGFLVGFEVEVARVDRGCYREYLGYDRWLYRGDELDV